MSLRICKLQLGRGIQRQDGNSSSLCDSNSKIIVHRVHCIEK